ncbi:SMI1/KNR4 family protein [Streptomyces sp. XH2]|uniref:SMI1/KNR4 family protein n=1 Tax=Streptomyces sp. XH2 TaxID=3412483 RepID=UPI003C7BA3D8
MADTTFDWRSFLVRWSEEWADACDPDDAPTDEDEAAQRARWLGFAPASGARIEALEERLGRRLPPSYRAFLEVSDGWRNAGGFVGLLAGTGNAQWYEDETGFGAEFRSYLREDPSPEELAEVGMWSRSLQLDVESDSTYVLMDPQAVSGDGEWAVYCYKVWAAGPPERYASFRAFMEAMYRQFHCLRAHSPAENGFVNATTRALDAVVEEAWQAALGGEYERAEAALAEPEAFGRPRAGALLGQIRLLLKEGQSPGMAYGLSAEVQALEIPPAPADGGASGRHTRVHPLYVGPLRTREAPFRYTTPGAFGAAVEEARELARWGDTDAAWSTLLVALPSWQPLDPTHLAPFGLLRDSLLGPLVTAERGRELLAVPRGPRAAAGPGPVAKGLDPGGLAWLADWEPRGLRMSEGYRFVLVEDPDPAGLPARLGADADTVLHEPMTDWDADQLVHGRGQSSTYDDKPLVSVGRAAQGWSFAFDGTTRGFDAERFVSPAAAASRGTRAVVVWSVPAGPHRASPAFHLSVAENGEESYAFTVDGGEVVRSGAVPPALDPDPALAGRAGERRVLEAIAAEFGVSLPRYALTSQDCRLHRFTTRSWTRPPGPGETYVVVRWG